jgi:uncharacterized protein (TIGR02001 family)
MNFGKAALALCAIAVSSLPVAAQELSFGATLTSNFIDRGATQSANGAAFQPWVEATFGGFYGGLAFSNINSGADRIETDLSFGYRWSRESTNFDIGYIRYYFDSTGDGGGEIYGMIEQSIGENTSVSGEIFVGHAGGLTVNNTYLAVSTGVANNLTGSIGVGVAGSTVYGDAGLTYQINDNFSVDGRLHSGAGGARWFVASIETSF